MVALDLSVCLNILDHYVKRKPSKTNKMTVRPAKTQIRLGGSSLCTQYVAQDPSFLHADSEDSDQTGRCPGWSESSLGAHAILLVLSGSLTLKCQLSDSGIFAPQQYFFSHIMTQSDCYHCKTDLTTACDFLNISKLCCIKLLLCWCFMALQHISGHFGCGQLAYSHCSWASLLGSLPVLSAHSFPSNWQLPCLNLRKGENSKSCRT